MRPADAGAKLLLQSRRWRLAATRQCPNDDAVCRIQLGDHRARHVAQPPRHPVALDCAAHGFGDDQADLRCIIGHLAHLSAGVYDKVRLCSSDTLLHDKAELN
jgi:hypothetical protein